MCFMEKCMQNVSIKDIKSPGYRLPKLHKDILSISLSHYKEIRKAYSEVLMLNAVDHLSINIVNPEGEIVFLSSTPYTGINVCRSGLWLYDTSIHPAIYENKEFCWWEDCYCQEMKDILHLEKEIKNNLNIGFIFSRKINDFYLLYSFATKEKDLDIKNMITQYQKTFLDMGDHCYSQIQSIYQRYAGQHEVPSLKNFNFPKKYRVVHEKS